MAIVHRTEDGYAIVDPYYRGDDYECHECGGAFEMTREEALRVADELRRIADSLITDEQDEAVEGIVDGVRSLCGPKPFTLTIQGYPPSERAIFSPVAEVRFKEE